MDIRNYESFASTWQSLVSTVKLSFASRNVTATHGFKQSYKLRTGLEFNMSNTGLSIAPIAVEPMQSRCRAAAVGCYIFMPNGHVYEGVIRVGGSADKALVHLVWFCAVDASKRAIIQMDNTLFKEEGKASSTCKIESEESMAKDKEG